MATKKHYGAMAHIVTLDERREAWLAPRTLRMESKAKALNAPELIGGILPKPSYHIGSLQYSRFKLPSYCCPEVPSDACIPKSLHFSNVNSQIPSGCEVTRLNPDGSEAIVINTDYYQGSAAPVLDAAGTVYVLASTAVAAFGEDGTNRWRLPSATAVQTAPVVGVDGTVFAG